MRIENVNITESSLLTNPDTSVLSEKKPAEVRNIYSGNENSGRLSATNVLKGLFSSYSSADEIKDAFSDMDADTIKKQMDMLSNSLTADDCRMMDEEGYSLLDMDTEAIVTVFDEIKIKLAEAGIDISDMGGLSASELDAAGKNAVDINRIRQAISEYNIPATDENISDIKEAAEMAAELEEINDATKKYMIDNELEPTIGNLYKASFASASAYLPGGGEDVFATVEKQAQSIVKEAGFDSAYGNDMARWLVNNDLPLTEENLKALDTLNRVDLPVDTQAIIEKTVDAISVGLRPRDTNLSSGETIYKRAGSALELMDKLEAEDADYVTGQGRPLTLENLREAYDFRQSSEGDRENQESESSVIITGQQSDDDKIKARRILEETRLVMTISANYSLLKRGISIETKELESLVEDLKKAENERYASILSSAGAEPTEENISLYKETGETINEVKLLPSFAIGRRSIENTTLTTLKDDGRQLLNEIDADAESIISSGDTVSDKMKQLNARYETMMTSPRADLGDSIKKAFRNVDDILEDMGLEKSESNERAVRILGYNSIEITGENINAMKAVDTKVQLLLKELTPSVTLHMIKAGINPLETDIDSLNKAISEIKTENGYDDSEDMAEFLWQLEQRGDISDEERAGYIGTYRLLEQVAASDGAVVGALVMQGAELNMKNLLSAVKTRKASGVDFKVDNEFGALEKLVTNGDTIREQLEKGYGTESALRTHVEETIEYNTEKAREILGMTDAGKMMQLCSRENFGEMSLEQVADAMREYEDSETAQDYSTVKYGEYYNMLSAEDEVIKLLSANEMSTNYYNTVAVEQMLNNRNGLYRQLLGKRDKDEKNWDAELEAVKEKIINDMGEAMKAPTDMAKAQQTLAEVAEHAMDNFMPADTEITSLDIRNMKLMREQLRTHSVLAEKEQYAIPVLVEDEMATVHLQIVRTDDKKGRVNVLFETEALGKVAAEIADMGERIEAMIVSQLRETSGKFAEIEGELEKELSTQEKKADIHIVTEPEINLTLFEMKDKTAEVLRNAVSPGEENEDNRLQTTGLYSMAKAFLAAVVRLGKAE